MAKKLVRAAGLLVYRQAGTGTPLEYLLLQTSYGTHHWTPPKGHVDPGENLFDTALRETLEEAGLSRNDLDIEESFQIKDSYLAHRKPKEVVYWLAQLKDYNTEVKLSNEHQAFGWFALAKACEIVVYAEMAGVLKKADDFLRSCKDV